MEVDRHVTRDNTLRESFGDGRLADSRFSDDDRIVLRAPRQYTDAPSNLGISPDDGVKFSLLCLRRQVPRVLAQRLEAVLGTTTVDLASASNGFS